VIAVKISAAVTCTNQILSTRNIRRKYELDDSYMRILFVDG